MTMVSGESPPEGQRGMDVSLYHRYTLHISAKGGRDREALGCQAAISNLCIKSQSQNHQNMSPFPCFLGIYFCIYYLVF